MDRDEDETTKDGAETLRHGARLEQPDEARQNKFAHEILKH
jgi:hypothetical protein